MGDILYQQTLAISAVKNTTPVLEKDFEILPYEQFITTAMSEDFAGRYNLPVSTVDHNPGMGTVNLGKVFVITPSVGDILVKFTNDDGQTQDLKFKAGVTSILHMDFLSFVISNPGPQIAKGRFLVVGD